MTWKRYFIFE